MDMGQKGQKAHKIDYNPTCKKKAERYNKQPAACKFCKAVSGFFAKGKAVGFRIDIYFFFQQGVYKGFVIYVFIGNIYYLFCKGCF